METKYKCVLGSRTYGLELPHSDVDIAVVNAEPVEGDRVDNHILSGEQFIRHLGMKVWYDPQLLYPKEVLEESGLSKILFDSRDEIIAASREVLYDTLMTVAKGLSFQFDTWQPKYPKRAAYAILHYNTLIRYAQGEPMAQALKPEGSLLDTLLLIRTRGLMLEDTKQLVEQYAQQAAQVAAFYQGTDSAAEKRAKEAIGEMERMLQAEEEELT